MIKGGIVKFFHVFTWKRRPFSRGNGTIQSFAFSRGNDKRI